jgi:hypothetical protein
MSKMVRRQRHLEIMMVIIHMLRLQMRFGVQKNWMAQAHFSMIQTKWRLMEKRMKLFIEESC